MPRGTICPRFQPSASWDQDGSDLVMVMVCCAQSPGKAAKTWVEGLPAANLRMAVPAWWLSVKISAVSCHPGIVGGSPAPKAPSRFEATTAPAGLQARCKCDTFSSDRAFSIFPSPFGSFRGIPCAGALSRSCVPGARKHDETPETASSK